MKTTVADIISRIQGERKTGLLSFTVVGQTSHFKVFFKSGQIYHLVCGSLKGQECLAHLDAFEFSSHSFISSIKLDVNGDGLPPTDEIVSFLHAIGKPILCFEEEPAPLRQEVSPEESVLIRNGLKVALMRQIGPAGDRIFTRVLQGRWDLPGPLGKEDFLELIGLLQEEIDDSRDRDEFLHEARGFLSGLERRTA